MLNYFLALKFRKTYQLITMKKYSTFFCSIILGFIFMSCQQDNISNPEPEIQQLNTFSMSLNNQDWRPSTLQDDACQKTFRCDLSWIDDQPFYTIQAFQDPSSRTDYQAEHYFKLQVVNVKNTGEYTIADAEGDFTSYALFIDRSSGTPKRYLNQTNDSDAKVVIQELFPVERSALIGVTGVFSGTLYYENDPNDFIEIKDCEFTFKRTNRVGFRHCEE